VKGFVVKDWVLFDFYNDLMFGGMECAVSLFLAR
jgi:hypothetical protein